MFKASLRVWKFLLDVVGNTPKPPALPAAPHPDIYSIFLDFAWKWDKLWSNANSTPFCVFLNPRKSAPLKAFRDFLIFAAIPAGHAPKPGALPGELHLDMFSFRRSGAVCRLVGILARSQNTAQWGCPA